MSGELPNWVEWLRALSVPAIAFAGLVIAGANLWLGYKKRRDDLFDRRYEVFEIAMIFGHGRVPNEQNMHELQNRIDGLTLKAQALFDEKFSQNLGEIITLNLNEGPYNEIAAKERILRLHKLFQKRI